MDITESFSVYANTPDEGDDRWVKVIASATEVLIQVNGRSAPCDETELRRLRAVVNHFLDAETVTEASTLAAIDAEFEEPVPEPEPEPEPDPE